MTFLSKGQYLKKVAYLQGVEEKLDKLKDWSMKAREIGQ